MAIESDVAHLHPDIVNDPNIGLTLQGAEKNASSRQRQVVGRAAKNRRHLPSTLAAHDGRQPSARDLPRECWGHRGHVVGIINVDDHDTGETRYNGDIGSRVLFSSGPVRASSSHRTCSSRPVSRATPSLPTQVSSLPSWASCQTSCVLLKTSSSSSSSSPPLASSLLSVIATSNISSKLAHAAN